MQKIGHYFTLVHGVVASDLYFWLHLASTKVNYTHLNHGTSSRLNLPRLLPLLGPPSAHLSIKSLI